jgi:tetratricopeptide (TPR) repeat protein
MERNVYTEMEKPLNFRFELPRPPVGPLVEVSSQEMEKLLLKKLEEAENNPTQPLWQLALFYKQIRQNGKALSRLQELIPLLPDPEERARCVMTMGQTMEQTGNYASAAGYYKQALALEPMNTWTWYFINNNLGFSLNIMERFGEAEPYCRKAIQTDPNRPNAYKNLGLSLSGQGQYREAAQCYVAATQVNAADPRAYHLLMDLLKNHPELDYDFETAAACCRKAVETAARKVEAMKPVVHRGWKKQFILFRAKVWAMIRRLWTGSPSEKAGPRY